RGWLGEAIWLHELCRRLVFGNSRFGGLAGPEQLLCAAAGAPARAAFSCARSSAAAEQAGEAAAARADADRFGADGPSRGGARDRDGFAGMDPADLRFDALGHGRGRG